MKALVVTIGLLLITGMVAGIMGLVILAVESIFDPPKDDEYPPDAEFGPIGPPDGDTATQAEAKRSWQNPDQS